MKFTKAITAILSSSALVFNIQLLSLYGFATTVSADPSCSEYSASSSCLDMDYFKEAPFVSPIVFQQGQVLTLDQYDESNQSKEEGTPSKTTTWSITGCCSKQSIGEIPQMTTQQSTSVLDNAIQGWDNGQGTWIQMSLKQRIQRIRHFVTELTKQRSEIIRVLMWEIGKNYSDAEAEFDRTMAFIEKSIQAIESSSTASSSSSSIEYNNDDEYNLHSTFKKIGSTNVFKRRNGFGIILCLGPYNYPLNETYATMIPALLMGNIIILKIPQVGGLSHLLTFEAFAKALPPNTIHFISGGGRKTLPPLMSSGKIDGLAFIGGTSAADKLITQHPEPHRLKIFLQLEAKNMAIVLNDLCDNDNGTSKGAYDLDKAVDDIMTGSLSYNGQRCTALKLIYVPRGYGLKVAEKIAHRVNELRIGMPWDTYTFDDEVTYSQITPLPYEGRITYMKELLDDAMSKGAQIVNANGGSILNNGDGIERSEVYSKDTLMKPAVIFPITKDMNIYKEEQFGPIIPVMEYDSLDDVIEYGASGIYGQQVSIFTSGDSEKSAMLVDAFSSIFGKININAQSGRSPDIVPFSARRSSGLGVMSIEDALKEFSVPTVVSFKEGKDGNIVDTVASIQRNSVFMADL